MFTKHTIKKNPERSITMKKRLISILLCVVMAVGCIFVPINASALDGEATTCSNGAVVKCGKYLYSLIVNNANYYKVVRTTTTGTKAKIIADKVENMTGKIFSCKTKLYYQDANKIKCYNTKTSKLSILKTLKYKDKSAKTISMYVTAIGICPKGLIVQYKNKGTYLISFNGKSKKMADSKENKIKSQKEYLTATDKYVFFHISEKKSKGIYTDRLYRYDLKKDLIKKMGTYESDKLSEAPFVTDSYVFKNKIVFISSSFDEIGGTVYSMNKKGNKIKKVMSGTNETFSPGKDCVYVQKADTTDGKYALYKINSKGKAATIIKPTILGINKPMLAITTITGYSLNMKIAKDYMSYDLYRNGKPSLKKGTLVMTGKSQGGSDEQIAIPLTYGTYGDMVLLTYAVMDMEDGEDAIYRTYFVNAKTGYYQLISK